MTATVVPGIYRHYKGNDYQVLGVARHSENDQQFVVYRPLYGAGELWIRPLDMFTEMVDHDGVIRARFALKPDTAD